MFQISLLGEEQGKGEGPSVVGKRTKEQGLSLFKDFTTNIK